MKNKFFNSKSLFNEIKLNNNTFYKKIILSSIDKKIFNNILKTNIIEIDSYDNLDLPIIEEKYNEIDCIDIYFKFINNINDIKLYLDKIIDDELYQIKLKMIFKVFIEISKNFYFNSIKNDNLIIFKKYIELTLIYLYTYVEEKLTDKKKIKENLNNFLIFNKVIN